MNLVRRIIVVLVGISLAILVTVLLLMPDTILSLAQNLNTTSLLIRLPLVILIDVIILAIIVVLVRGERAAMARSNGGLIVKAQGAVADVSVESARERVLRAVRNVPDVLSADAVMKAVNGKADIELDVVVSRDSVNVPEKQKEIDRALRQVLNKQLGLQIAGKPRVHLRMGEDDVPASPVVLPAPVPTPVPPPAVEPVKPEPVVVVPVKAETSEFRSGMTLRNDNENEAPPESVDPAT
jgi:hypothetical protein